MGGLITHVDDILVGALPSMNDGVHAALSAIFPTSTWEKDPFDYTGSAISQDPVTFEVTLSQKSYVNSRLEVAEVTAKVNMSTIGALSWLASQSRLDLQTSAALPTQM